METYGIEKLGIVNPKAVYRNLTPAQLTEAALRRGEGKLSNTGALVVTCLLYTSCRTRHLTGCSLDTYEFVSLKHRCLRSENLLRDNLTCIITRCV